MHFVSYMIHLLLVLVYTLEKRVLHNNAFEKTKVLKKKIQYATISFFDILNKAILIFLPHSYSNILTIEHGLQPSATMRSL